MVGLKGAKVLVVEDEYLVAADLIRSLGAAGGEPVGPAGSVEQARQLLEEQPVDAAILDLNLRGDMAYPLLNELSRRGLPVVIMSGYSPETLSESIGPVPSLEKPVDFDRVVRALESELASQSS